MAQILTSAQPNQTSTLINLLPPELLSEHKKKLQISVANQFSVIALILLVGITSAALVLRILQSNKLAEVDSSVAKAEEQINSQKDKENYLLTMKQRISSIKEIVKDNKKAALFSFIATSLPAEVRVTDATIEKDGNMSLTVTTSSLDALDRFLLILTKQKTEPALAEVSLDALSRSKGEEYQLSLEITPQ